MLHTCIVTTESAHAEAVARWDRYLEITRWARDRYRRADGSWIRSVGRTVAGRHYGPLVVPSRYTMIEELASRRYMGTTPRWTDETLATAYRG